MNRLYWALLLAPVGWYAMMAAHELGHIVSALIHGGSIDSITLVPWSFSQTLRHGSSAPAADIWAGVIGGSLLPLVIWLCTLHWPSVRLFTGIFAGFCCIANGTYFGIGGIDGVGDTGELMALGFPIWPIIVFGITAIVVGFLLWHVEIERNRSA